MAQPTDAELLEQMGKLPKGASRRPKPEPPPLPGAEPLLKCLNDAIQAWVLSIEGVVMADVNLHIKPPTAGNDVDASWAVEIDATGLGNIDGGQPTTVYQHTWSGIGDDLAPALDAVRKDLRAYLAGRITLLEAQRSAYEQAQTSLSLSVGLDDIWDAPEDRPDEDGEPMPAQVIEGSGNIQAGGNVTVR